MNKVLVHTLGEDQEWIDPDDQRSTTGSKWCHLSVLVFMIYY